MILKNFWFFPVILTIFPFLLFARKEGHPSISEADLKRHITFLASDSLQGRKFGTAIPGLEIAADYIRENARNTGLIPLADHFFQKVDIVSAILDEDNSFLAIWGPDHQKEHQTRSVICLNQQKGNVKASGEALLSGFGLSLKKGNELGMEDSGFEGKIVLCATGTPETYREPGSGGWNNTLERSKSQKILDAGACAVILVTSPKEKHDQTFSGIRKYMSRERYVLRPDSAGDTGKVFVTNVSFADALLGEEGAFEAYLDSLSGKGGPGNKIFGEVIIEVQTVMKTEPVDAYNVVGYIEGSDPELKDECIVYMAHYDHLGIGDNGDVFNGADDNASGVATLLELAEAFSDTEPRPKRSIVFLWVTAEEVGLLGSAYYGRNPLFPLEKTVACINLDMVGRVREPRDSVWDHSPKKIKDFDGIYTLVSPFSPPLANITDSVCTTLGLVPDTSLPDYFFRSSDHHHFHSRGVPILNLATGYHADYHKVTDEVSRIRFDKIVRVANLCYGVGVTLANQ